MEISKGLPYVEILLPADYDSQESLLLSGLFISSLSCLHVVYQTQVYHD